MKYKRLTERDCFGNADIINVPTEKIYDDLSFEEINHLTRALNRLAKLEDKIEDGTLSERKTCTNVTEQHPVDEFICSECGLILEEYHEKRIDDGDETYHEYEIKYCPNCGAKVVEE